VFNAQNDAWKTGIYPIFLGQAPGLYDSINTNYPQLFKIYKRQKAQDWAENEINLEQSRMDMLSCPTEVRDIMLKNIAAQWLGDTRAMNCISTVLAPFVTNSEAWIAILKNTEVEGLHALTYSEIVRQCIPNVREAFEAVVDDINVLERFELIDKIFDYALDIGAKKRLGLSTPEEEYDAAMMTMLALWILERLQFMVSFAATFAVVEAGWFQGIGTLVQKIMLDEFFCHAEFDYEILKIELATERGQAWLAKNLNRVKETLDAGVAAEKRFGNYLFSDGRKTVGLNVVISHDWVDYCAFPMYDFFGLSAPKGVKIAFMDDWLDIDAFQNANQEADNNNYLLNVVIDDMDDSKIYD
jgi:ribonucleoside-diphosphate reductase beta chain